jgi:hypothetical protein
MPQEAPASLQRKRKNSGLSRLSLLCQREISALKQLWSEMTCTPEWFIVVRVPSWWYHPLLDCQRRWAISRLRAHTHLCA